MVHEYTQKRASEKWRMIGLLVYFLFVGIVAYGVFTLPLFHIMISFSILFLYLGCFFLLTYIEHERKPTPILQKWPSLAIVIPAYNRGESLRTCLECVTKIQYPKKMQILVVDDASTDHTQQILEEFKKKGIQSIRQPQNGGKSHAINTGIKKVKGEIIVVMDGDSYPAPDSVMKLVPNFYSHENVGAVTTIVRVHNRKGLLQRIQEVEYFLEFGLKNSVLNTLDSLYVTPGPLSAYKREALEKAGGYDEHNITEDMEITFHLHKLGYRIVLEPDAQVFTDVPDTIPKLYKQRQRWSYGGWQTIHKYRKDLFSKQKFFFRIFFPLRVLLDISAVFFLMLATRMGMGYFHDIQGTLTAYSTISFETIVFPPFYLNSHVLLYLLIVVLTLLMAYFGTRAAGAPARQLSPLGIFLFLSIYWVFIIFIQATSLLRIIYGGRQKW
ncbi:MAG: glycosyltransferase [Candidatus Diapherotrites archaeon]